MERLEEVRPLMRSGEEVSVTSGYLVIIIFSSLVVPKVTTQRNIVPMFRASPSSHSFILHISADDGVGQDRRGRDDA